MCKNLFGEPSGLKQEKAIANQEKQQSGWLQSFLGSGTLPAGLTAILNQAGQSATADVNSEYAQAGIGGASSARLGGIQNVNTNIAAEKGKMAQQLYDMGLQELGMSGTTYHDIIQDSMANDQMIMQGISDFASVLGGSDIGSLFGSGDSGMANIDPSSGQDISALASQYPEVAMAGG